MGLFVLLAALAETINETVKEKIEYTRAEKERREYENIDFYNIDYVTFDGTEPAYRIEVEEEFDPVMTNFLSDMDGWAHYETKEVEYEVPDGENYLFTIRYKDGSEIYRKFHEDSHLTERLLEYCDNQDNELEDSLNEVVCALNNIVSGNMANIAHTLNNSISRNADIDKTTDEWKLPLMCPHCKTKIPQESVYCCYCGKKI